MKQKYNPDMFDNVDSHNEVRVGAYRKPKSKAKPLIILTCCTVIVFLSATLTYFNSSFFDSTANTVVVDNLPPKASETENTEESKTPSSSPEPTSDAINKSINLTISNATKTNGLAGKAKEKLEAEGYTTVNTGTSKTAAKISKITYALEADKATAEEIIKVLNLNVIPTLDPSSPGIIVTLGQDYKV